MRSPHIKRGGTSIQFLKAITPVLFPASCLSCRVDISWQLNTSLCDVCLRKLHALKPPQVGQIKGLDGVFARSLYADPLKDLIHQFKYGGKDYLAPLLSDFLLRDLKILERTDVLIPVPTGLWKQFHRGFNQARLLSDRLSQAGGLRHEPVLLGRHLFSFSQAPLPEHRRRQNARRSFYIRDCKLDLKDKRICLVDDVCTTGSTLRACADLLRQRGAARVFAVVLAYEPRRGY